MILFFPSLTRRLTFNVMRLPLCSVCRCFTTDGKSARAIFYTRSRIKFNSVGTNLPMNVLKKTANYEEFKIVKDVLQRVEQGYQTEILSSFNKRYNFENDCEQNLSVLKDFSTPLKEKVNSMEDHELFETIAILGKTFTQKTPHPEWKEFCKIVDQECQKRLKASWDTQSKLVAACLWMEVGYFKYNTDYPYVCLRKLIGSISNVETTQAVQVLHLLAILKVFPREKDAYKLQLRVAELLPKFNLNEAAVALIAVNGALETLNNVILAEPIVRKLINEIETCNTTILIPLLKAMTNCAWFREVDLLLEFYEKAIPSVSRLPLTVLPYLPMSGIGLPLHHPPLLKAVVDRLKENLSEVTLLDINRILLTTEVFCYEDQEFYDKVIHELSNRPEETIKRASIFVSCILHLVLSNKYPTNLISQVFSPEFQEQIRSNNFRSPLVSLYEQLAVIDVLVERLKPDYAGPRMNENLRCKNLKKNYHKVHRQTSKRWKKMEELEALLKSMYGADKVRGCPWVAKHIDDWHLVVGFDSDLNAVLVPDDLESKGLPDDGNTWLRLYSGYSEFTDFKTYVPVGEVQALFRYLEALGCTPVLINMKGWKLRDEQNRKDYLEKIIMSKLEETRAKKQKLQVQ